METEMFFFQVLSKRAVSLQNFTRRTHVQITSFLIPFHTLYSTLLAQNAYRVMYHPRLYGFGFIPHGS